MPINHNVIKSIITKIDDIYVLVKLRKLSKYWCMYLDNNKEIKIDNFLKTQREVVDMIKCIILDCEKLYILKGLMFYYWKDDKQILVCDINGSFLNTYNITIIIYFTVKKYVEGGLKYHLFNTNKSYGTVCIK